MSINKKIIVAALATLTLGATSCKKYLDVNNNPNVAQVGKVETLLPAAQLYLGSAMGVDMQITGSIWAQHWTQSPDGKEYIPFEQFTPKQEAFSSGWRNLYTGASNFYQLQKMAEAQHNNNYHAIALLMQAYAFQVATDAWGDVPFREASKGLYADGHLVNPKYDSQQVVYMGIITYIDSAKRLIANAKTGARTPGADDLIYGGNMAKWTKFANTLKLRTLLRMADADPSYALPAIDTLYLAGSQFIGEGDEAVVHYGSGSGNNNPLYAELSSTKLGGTQQLAGSKTCIDSMNSNNDYRGVVFYNNVNSLGLIGIAQSEYDIAMPSGSFSTPNAYVGADATNAASGSASVMLMSSWESFFLQAEVAAKGYVAGSDATLFYAGIHASFMYYNNAIMAETGVDAAAAFNIYVNGDVPNAIPAAYWSLYPTIGSIPQKMRHIITAKWFASCGSQGFEAWTEWRRTGYPDFLVSPRNGHLGTELPSRCLYPQSEVLTNSNYPGLAPINARMWWDML